MSIASMSSQTSDRVIAFPLIGQTRLIRRCASELENLHGEDALRYWKSECRALAARLKNLGCEDEDISRQVMAFQTEVQVEMMCRYSKRLGEVAEEAVTNTR